jgi:hypothetical protein
MTKDNVVLTLFLSLVLLLTGAQAASADGVAPAPPRDVVSVDHTWVCDGPVALDSVTVTINAGLPDRLDAIRIASGCTGWIGRIDVTQYAADGVKVAQGAHDLRIGGGRVRCLDKAPTLHQDGVQVMGGLRIAFENLSIDCGRAADSLIDSNFFVNQAGTSTEPPTDVVCDHCTLGGWAAHTANIQTSVRSGVTNSTICVGRYPKLTLTLADDARSALSDGNSIQACA